MERGFKRVKTMKKLFLAMFLFILVLPMAYTASMSASRGSMSMDYLTVTNVAFTGFVEDQPTYLSFRLNNVGDTVLTDIVVTVDTDTNVPDIVFNIPSMQPGQTIVLATNWIYATGGTYHPSITVAHDSNSNTYPQTVVIQSVNDAPVMTSFNIIQTQVNQGDNFDYTGTFSDEEQGTGPMFLGLCTTSNCNNCNKNTQSGCFAYQMSATSGSTYSASSNGLPGGGNTLYSRVCDNENLCSNIMSDSINIGVNAAPTMTAFNIIQTQVNQGDNFDYTGTFSDPEQGTGPLFMGLCTSSNCNNCDKNTQSGCFAYQTSAMSGSTYSTSSNGLPAGANTLYSRVCDDGNLCSTILSDTITIIVNAAPTMTSFNIVQTSVPLGSNFDYVGTFSDPEQGTGPLFMGLCTTSNCNNCDKNTQSGCFAYQTAAMSGSTYSTSSNGLPAGANTIYSRVCDNANLCSSILSDIITLTTNTAPTMTAFNIVQTQVITGENFDYTGTFSDPEQGSGPLFMGLCTTSNCINCNTNTQSGCFAYQTAAMSGTTYTASSAGLPLGSNTIYSHVCDNANLCSSILSDTITINPVPYTVTGVITDLFTHSLVSGATVTIAGSSTTTNANGEYTITGLTNLPTYSNAVITKTSYTTRHTWLTTESGGGSYEANYTIIPLTTTNWSWELYNKAFRRYTITQTNGMGNSTIHWVNPPPMHVFNDSTYVPGYDIEANYNNSIVNLQTILPTFNPVDALPDNVVTHVGGLPTYTLPDGEMMVYWYNSMTPIGEAICFWDGPTFIKCVVRFKWSVGCNSGCIYPGPDNTVFNQELGTAFGAVKEPGQSANYVSVFTDPTTVSTYTAYDYKCADVYLNRSKVHFQNFSYSYTDPEGYDWDMRPDLVQEWFPGGSKKSKMTVYIRSIYENGSIEEQTYDYDKVPISIMKDNPMMFSKEDIAKREKASAGDYKKVSQPKRIISLGNYDLEVYDLNNLPDEMKKFFKGDSR